MPATSSTDNSDGCAQQSAGTGVAGSIASNRFSFTFGMMGPSVTMDTEASSVLVCLNAGMVACSPRKVDADKALCTGSTVAMSPVFFMRTCVERQAGRKGRCLTFDASADGYVRGEGVVAIVIDNLLQEVDGKLMEDKSRETYGIIDHVAVKFCAFQATVTAPNAAEVQALIQEALLVAGIAGTSVDQLEAHGSGQPLWDGVELAAAQKVYQANDFGHTRPIPLMVTSVRSNIGHSKQPSAGFAFLKAMMTGLHGQIPPSVHLYELNPLLRDAVELNCNLLNEGLPCAATKSIIGVTALGFGGTLGHAVLEVDCANNAEEKRYNAAEPEQMPAFWRNEESST